MTTQSSMEKLEEIASLRPKWPTAQVTISFDGAAVLKDHALDARHRAGPVLLDLGVAFVSAPTGPIEVRYDDVTLDLE